MPEIIKTIHYCWFGGNPLSDTAIRCIESWKKYFPGYEIKEWNETNFDVKACKYTAEAYEKKRWAFVSDYARLWILYAYGGLYFDTDVEVIKSMDDILARGAFMGCEGRNINAGLGMYAEPGLDLYAAVLKHYEKEAFLLKDGSCNLKTVVTRVTEVLERYGFDRFRYGEIQNICGVFIYPSDYFCPMDFNTRKLCITGNTRSIHHYDNSWFDERGRYWQTLRLKLNRFLPNWAAARIAFVVSYMKYGGIRKFIAYIKYKEK